MTLEMWMFWMLTLFQLSVYVLIERKYLIIGSGFSFLAIWLIIVSWTLLPISNLSRELSDQTVNFLGTIFTSYFVGYLLSFHVKQSKYREVKIICRMSDNKLLLIMGFLALLNILVSGYIPLLNIIQGLSSAYTSFGIPTIYGMFNAYCNFIGMYFYYNYLLSNKKQYLGYVFLIILIFFILVTRQNIITLILECCIIRIIFRYNIKFLIKLGCVFVVLLYGFAVLGEFRSGNIYEIAEILPQYEWMPSSFVWLYSYSVFNLINLDNLILLDQDPLYNFSSFSRLLPSFLRPEMNSTVDFLEKINFNVSTYLSGIYIDLGIWGTSFFAFIQGYFVNKYYLSMKNNDKLKFYFTILFVCNLLSFFVNMFFYLPVIGQVFFVMLLLKPKEKIEE